MFFIRNTFFFFFASRKSCVAEKDKEDAKKWWADDGAACFWVTFPVSKRIHVVLNCYLVEMPQLGNFVVSTLAELKKILRTFVMETQLVLSLVLCRASCVTC